MVVVAGTISGVLGGNHALVGPVLGGGWAPFWNGRLAAVTGRVSIFRGTAIYHTVHDFVGCDLLIECEHVHLGMLYLSGRQCYLKQLTRLVPLVLDLQHGQFCSVCGVLSIFKVSLAFVQLDVGLL